MKQQAKYIPQFQQYRYCCFYLCFDTDEAKWWCNKHNKDMSDDTSIAQIEKCCLFYEKLKRCPF